VIPVAMCGLLMAIDAVPWARGRMDLYDPAGIVGLLSTHGFFLAPLLNAAWNEWMPMLSLKSGVTPLDWRDWAGWMGVLNALGLLLYRMMRRRVVTAPLPARRYAWEIDLKRFVPLLTIAMIVSAILQIWVYKQSGGIVGYVTSFQEDTMTAFKGMGIIFMLSETFPVLMMMGFVVYARRHPFCRRWIVILPMMGLMLVLQLLFGGLRGSRSNTVWALFWGLGMIHLFVRKIPRGLILVVLPVLISFMYIYGYYKNLAQGGAQVLAGTMSQEEFHRKTGRGVDSVLVENLSRTDVQALVLYRVTNPTSDYQLGWGRSYLGALALLIPGSLWPDRPPTVALEGTNALYGADTYNPSTFSTSYVFGIGGEAMLNFGWVSVPFALAIYGLLVGWVRRKMVTWPALDPRLLVLPFLINLTFVAMQGDSDNIVYFLVKNGLVPLSVLFFSCRHRRLPAAPVEAVA
jgi:hypothetical protein